MHLNSWDLPQFHLVLRFASNFQWKPLSTLIHLRTYLYFICLSPPLLNLLYPLSSSNLATVANLNISYLPVWPIFVLHLSEFLLDANLTIACLCIHLIFGMLITDNLLNACSLFVQLTSNDWKFLWIVLDASQGILTLHDSIHQNKVLDWNLVLVAEPWCLLWVGLDATTLKDHRYARKYLNKLKLFSLSNIRIETQNRISLL